MCLLVRKIERGKWVQNDILGGETVSADAITNCMKTTGNALSVWQVPDQAAVSEAVLAMASEFKHLDAIDIALLDQSSLADAGLRIVESKGGTRVQRLVNTHRHIADLNYDSLGIVARLIVECFEDDRIQRFTKGGLIRLLKQAIEDGSINGQDLRESVRSKVC